MLDNRELAALIWLGIAFAWILSQETMRPSLAGLLRSFLKPAILIPLLFMLSFISLEVWLGFQIGLWSPALLKGTIIWTVISATVLAFNTATNPGDPRFFRKTLAGAIGATIFLEFFMNLVVMDLWAELILQPLITLLALITIVAGMNADDKQVKTLAESISAILGFSLLVFTVWQLHAHWAELDHAELLREFLLPLWLTIGFLPFLFLLRLYVPYDAALRGINWATADRRARWRARAALVRSLHIRSRELADFAWNWCKRLADAPSYSAAREVIDQFQTQRREAEQAAADKQERLERYAGVDGVDANGRCLDRREFKETMDALTWIHTCQMGWYRNHGARYRTDLLDIVFGSDFARRGLPEEHGITLSVATDGQSWYAWRRTTTGWCFAIGAAGPPPDQWEYDGPDPPDGFPGQDPTWGSAPVSNDANPNWH